MAAQCSCYISLYVIFSVALEFGGYPLGWLRHERTCAPHTKYAILLEDRQYPLGLRIGLCNRRALASVDFMGLEHSWEQCWVCWGKKEAVEWRLDPNHPAASFPEQEGPPLEFRKLGIRYFSYQTTCSRKTGDQKHFGTRHRMGDAERPALEGGFYIVISHASRTRILRKGAPILYHCSQAHVPAWALHEQNRYIPSFPDAFRVRTLSINRARPRIFYEPKIPLPSVDNGSILW